MVSCASKIPFTSDIQNEYQFQEAQLKKVQFYTSDEIVLTQTESNGDASVTDGKVLLKNQKHVEIIIIKKNTPCVVESVIDNNKFLFSFEYGKDRVLLFGNNSTGYYSLMSKEWKNKTTIIDYASKKYTTTNGDVFLKIKVKKLNQLKGRQRRVKGRKVH